MTEHVLEIGGTPPSLNAVSKRNHWPYTKAKREWEGFLMIALLQAKVPKGLSRVHATAVLRFKQRRRRDEGNFRWLLEKALGDTLQKGGWLADDTADEFTFGEVVFDEESGSPLTTVTLEVAP